MTRTRRPGVRGALLLGRWVLAGLVCATGWPGGQGFSAAASNARAEMRGTALEAGTRRPLAGAVAALQSETERGVHFLTCSDGTGRFIFQTLPPGVYSLEVTLAGYRAARKNGVEIRPPFRSIIEMAMTRGSDGSSPGASTPTNLAPAAPGGAAVLLSVTLVDREQRPVPEGLVVLVPLGMEEQRRFGKTDNDGKVEFGDLPPLGYRLTASAPGFLTVRTERLALSGVPRARVGVVLTPYPLDFAGSLEDLLPPEEPLLPHPLPPPDP